MRFKTYLLEFFGNETKIELSRKEYPEFGYYSKTEEIIYPNSKPFTMTSFYTIDGDYYIGNENWAKLLTQKRGLTKIQTTFKNSNVANIGFNEKEQKWYGWSHRAIFGFGIGDKIFKQNFGNDKTKFSEHGDKKIETLSDAKKSASRFAEYVS